MVVVTYISSFTPITYLQVPGVRISPEHLSFGRQCPFGDIPPIFVAFLPVGQQQLGQLYASLHHRQSHQLAVFSVVNLSMHSIRLSNHL